MKALLFLFVSFAALAADRVCVRNYHNRSMSPCDRYPRFYSYVVPADGSDKRVCTRSYNASYCRAKEYATVHTVDGKEICVLNGEQEPVVNLCKSLPNLYTYVRP